MQIGLSIDAENVKGPVKIKAALTCPICSMMLQLPVMRCQDCGNYFCQSCLSGWWTKQDTAGKCIYKCTSSELKTVKRQAIFLPMLELLQFPCQNMGCQQVSSHQSLKRHIQSCEFAIIACQYCKQQKTRKQIPDHHDICVYKTLPCCFCQMVFLRKDLNQHQKQCPEKLVKCSNQGCSDSIKSSLKIEHQKNCQYKLIQCVWCKQLFIQKNLQQHDKLCEKKQIQCQGCQQSFLKLEFQKHFLQCEQIKIKCQVCDEQFSRKEIGSIHNINKCMIATIKQLKIENLSLKNQNIQMKIMMDNLSNKFNDLINQKDKSSAHLVQSKHQQYLALQRDLQRIEYSQNNVQKLKQQQVTNHTKSPHLLGNWCLTCRQIDKKFSKLLEPLQIHKKQIMEKLNALKPKQK